MRTNATLAALLALPMLMMGCNRHDQSPAAAVRGQDRQATAPSMPDKGLDTSPPAASKQPDSSGTPSSSAQSPAASSAPASPSAPAQPGEAPKAN